MHHPAYLSYYPVYTREPPEYNIPKGAWIPRWMSPVEIDNLPKIQLKVRMCCPKCAEIVREEIREVPGVVEVRAYWTEDKVVVTTMPWPVKLDKDEVLRKARIIDSKARFVKLDIMPKGRVIVKPFVQYPGYPSRLPDYYPVVSLPPVYWPPRPPSPRYYYEPSPRMATRPSTSSYLLFYLFL